MIEYIEAFCISIWRWVVDNKESITTFIMSGQFASLIAALVMLLRHVKQVKNNTNSTNTLNKTLENTNSMSTSVKTLDTNFQLLKIENDSLRTELKETEEQLQLANNEIKNKLNAIIEVQAIVYSTIRDDSVRQTVSTILNNARYSEKNFKEDLQSQIAELKSAYENEVSSLNLRLSEGLEKVSASIKASEQAELTMKKKHENNVRY